jgi:hypothetical protein
LKSFLSINKSLELSEVNYSFPLAKVRLVPSISQDETPLGAGKVSTNGFLVFLAYIATGLNPPDSESAHTYTLKSQTYISPFLLGIVPL